MAPNGHRKRIGVDGIHPTFETISSRRYRYTTEVFVATRAGLDPTSPAARLASWLRTSVGQNVVRKSGYVPTLGP